MSTQFQARQKETLPLRRLSFAAEQRLQILQKLQGLLDMEILFESFTQELEKQVDVTRLIWSYEGISHIIRRGEQGPFRQTFSLKFGSSSLGFLQYNTPYKFDTEEINLTHIFHRLLAGPLYNAIEYNRVRNLALLDGLTGLNNRARFDQDLLLSISLTKRKNNGLILMIFDMDNFKQVNDRFGHLCGDKILCQFSYQLSDAIRLSDQCYRLGGDEFAVILSPATNTSAQQVNQRLKSLISNDPLLRSHNITSAAGCALYRQGDTVNSMFERADRAMYRNKNAR